MSHHYSGPNFGFPRGDARLDLTDFYAFPKPGDTGKSILIMNVHPSSTVIHPERTTIEPFAANALYEIKIDTNGDAVADIAYRMRVSSQANGAQIVTLRRVVGAEAAGTEDGGQVIVEGSPVSTGRDARITHAGDYRFFAGRRNRALQFAHELFSASRAAQDVGRPGAAAMSSCSRRTQLPIRRRPEGCTQMYDQRRNLGRNAPLFRVSDEDGGVLWLRANIHDTQRLPGQRIMNEESRQERDAETIQGRIAHYDAIVDPQDASWPNSVPPAPLPEPPIRGAAIGIDDAPMIRQILRCLGHPVAFEIGGGCNQHAPAWGEMFYDQAAARTGAVTDDGVETIGRADETVVEFER
jgi:hypothetical protein